MDVSKCAVKSDTNMWTHMSQLMIFIHKRKHGNCPGLKCYQNVILKEKNIFVC